MASAEFILTAGIVDADEERFLAAHVEIDLRCFLKRI